MVGDRLYLVESRPALFATIRVGRHLDLLRNQSFVTVRTRVTIALKLSTCEFTNEVPLSRSLPTLAEPAAEHTGKKRNDAANEYVGDREVARNHQRDEHRDGR
jgi:hypothetical protein